MYICLSQLDSDDQGSMSEDSDYVSSGQPASSLHSVKSGFCVKQGGMVSQILYSCLTFVQNKEVWLVKI